MHEIADTAANFGSSPTELKNLAELMAAAEGKRGDGGGARVCRGLAQVILKRRAGGVAAEGLHAGSLALLSTAGKSEGRRGIKQRLTGRPHLPARRWSKGEARLASTVGWIEGKAHVGWAGLEEEKEASAQEKRKKGTTGEK